MSTLSLTVFFVSNSFSMDLSRPVPLTRASSFADLSSISSDKREELAARLAAFSAANSQARQLAEELVEEARKSFGEGSRQHRIFDEMHRSTQTTGGLCYEARVLVPSQADDLYQQKMRFKADSSADVQRHIEYLTGSDVSSYIRSPDVNLPSLNGIRSAAAESRKTVEGESPEGLDYGYPRYTRDR